MKADARHAEAQIPRPAQEDTPFMGQCPELVAELAPCVGIARIEAKNTIHRWNYLCDLLKLSDRIKGCHFHTSGASMLDVKVGLTRVGI